MRPIQRLTFVGCLAALFIPAATGAQEVLRTGSAAPAFTLRTLTGEDFSLGGAAGKGPQARQTTGMLVFFSTDSIASRKRLPMLAAASRRWRGAGVEAVFVGARDTSAELQSFATEIGLEGRIAPDSFGRVSSRYGVVSLPHLVIVDAAGKLAFQQAGDIAGLETLVDQQLAAITGAPIPPPETEASTTVIATRLTFGRAPAANSTAEKWKPLADFIGSRVGEVTVQPAASYDAFQGALKAGAYDIVSAGALQYVEVRDLYEPVAKTVRREQSFYYGVIFVRDDSGIQKLADLKGRTVAFVNEHSTSGYLFPTLLLRESGLRPKDVKTIFAGSHEAVAKAVFDGTAEVGACFEDCRTMLWPDPQDREEKTTIIAFTREIPADPILVRKSLPAPIKAAVRRAILDAGLDRALLASLSEREIAITAFAPANADEFAWVKRAADTMKPEPPAGRGPQAAPGRPPGKAR